IDEETFYKVQKLIKQNTKTKHNGTKIIKHTYILNGGLLWCGKCGSQMEGTCGTGRRGNKYFFYVCKDKDCRFKLPADEIERIIIERIKYLSSDSGLMQKLIEHTNDKLMKELPQLKCRRTHLQKELAEVKAFADGIMNKWTAMATDDSSIFLKEKLAELGQRRKEIETGIASLEAMIKEIERESISQELVTLALSRFSDLFDKIKPYRQKDMVRLVLHKATLSPTKMQIALYGRQPDTGLLDLCESDSEEIRCQTSNWLGGYGYRSVVISVFGLYICHEFQRLGQIFAMMRDRICRDRLRFEACSNHQKHYKFVHFVQYFDDRIFISLSNIVS
ncbi:MAG: zinc ribbon domain-containing protein, partial [Candidatus Omnitrophota bacterium]